MFRLLQLLDWFGSIRSIRSFRPFRLLRFGTGCALGAMLVFFFAGCRFDPAGSESTKHGDSQPPSDRPFMDSGVDTALPDREPAPDARVDTAVDAGCLDDLKRCIDDTREVCVNGQWVVEYACLLGCHPNLPRCNQMAPSLGVQADWFDEGYTAFRPTTDVMIDTEIGTIDPGVSGTFAIESLGPYDCGDNHFTEATVFVFSEIEIPEGVTVRVRGPKAAVLMSFGPIAVSGMIDVSGGRQACPQSMSPTDRQPWCAGPGGFAGGRAAAVDPEAGRGPGGGGGGYSDGTGLTDETSGGGGGHGGSGGAGGDELDEDFNSGGAGGATYGSPEPLHLCGGSGGGGGGGGSGWSQSGHGGGGGGAVALISQAAIVVDCVTGSCGVQAGGAGGQADHLATYDDGGGGGGGGGMIVLEAPAVEIGANGVLAAGGGGGAGGYNGGLDCNDGQDGLFFAARAAGGTGSLSGGAGGGADVGSGEDGDGGDDGTGGGGGGAGWIRINTYEALVLDGVVNPAQTTGLATSGSLGLQ
jgi:hypothetical protein